MNITFVLAVYNKLDLTKDCYKHLREVYPTAPLVISSGGSNDGTKEWLESLDDNELSYVHTDDRITFSDNYNSGIDLVDTDKLVLIHNDMVIGNGFLETLERLLTPDTLLSYTTIEPPIFMGHNRPGKVILEMGRSFQDFDHNKFQDYVEKNNTNDTLHDGAVFFMSGYKDMFKDIGGFDGFSFFPCFCEDDDFLIRAKLKGYKLKTCESAIVYHFVSQTSRFSKEMENNRNEIEINSNRNFVRKWGIPISSFNQLKYWEQEDFVYKTFTMGFKTQNKGIIPFVEPFFDKIDLGEIPGDYIDSEQKNTNYNLYNKFVSTDDVDVMVYEMNPITQQDFNSIQILRPSLVKLEPNEYVLGNMKIVIRKKI